MPGVLNMLLASGSPPGIVNGGLPNGGALGTATFQLNNDGSATISGSGAVNWVTPANASVAALYEVKVDVTGGAFASGTTGTWLDMATTRTWTDAAGGSGVTFTVSFRDKATSTIRSTQAGITLTGAL